MYLLCIKCIEMGDEKLVVDMLGFKTLHGLGVASIQ